LERKKKKEINIEKDDQNCLQSTARKEAAVGKEQTVPRVGGGGQVRGPSAKHVSPIDFPRRKEGGGFVGRGGVEKTTGGTLLEQRKSRGQGHSQARASGGQKLGSVNLKKNGVCQERKPEKRS